MDIYVTRPSIPDYDEYCGMIKTIFDKKLLTNRGPLHEQLLEVLKDRFKVDNLELCVNGHIGLELAIEALGLRNCGGEVITTPYTFISTTNAIVRNGLTPVFCDIKESDMTIDEDKIEALITDKTVAILPVHVYGNPCNTVKIQEIADRHNLKVIYDAAHAFDVSLNDTNILNYGDASMVSFHATKGFNTIEGGAVSFKDPEVASKFRCLTNFGITGLETADCIGSNGKMDEFRAAMGLCNIKRIDAETEKRKHVVELYRKRLSEHKDITLSGRIENSTENYIYFPVIFSTYELRDKVYKTLRDNHIIARKYFYPAVNDFEAYKEIGNHDTAIATHISKSVLTLPLYSGLELDTVNKICDIVLGVLE